MMQGLWFADSTDESGISSLLLTLFTRCEDLKLKRDHALGICAEEFVEKALV